MKPELNEVLPVLPTGELVAFPGLVIPLLVSEGPAHDALRFAVENDLPVVVALTSAEGEHVPGDSLSKTAVWARVIASTSLPDHSLKVRLHIEGRVKIDEVVEEEPSLKVKVTELVPNSKTKISKSTEKVLQDAKANMLLLSLIHI